MEDRFKDALQRLDLYHANTYLWAVANELHGAASPEARRWVKPLLKQIRNDQVANVITQLAELKPQLAAAAAKAADQAIEYYQNNQKRMKYKQARQRKEPVGSRAIESTCRQLQCRMKRCGQFWSTQGDQYHRPNGYRELRPEIGLESDAWGGYLSFMRRWFIWLLLAGGLAVVWPAQAATGRVIKVLPQFLDLKGLNSLSPSLYERDTYQAHLRDHTNLCSGMRFTVQWKAKGQAAAPLKLRVELRGVARGDFPKQLLLEKPVTPGGWFSHWTDVSLLGEEFKSFGQITAWRVTLCEGPLVLGEQKSFLW